MNAKATNSGAGSEKVRGEALISNTKQLLFVDIYCDRQEVESDHKGSSFGAAKGLRGGVSGHEDLHGEV